MTEPRSHARFGALSLHPRASAAIGSFCAALNAQLAEPLRPDEHASYDALLAAFCAGTMELCWMPPLLSARAIARGGTLLAVPQRAGSLIYRSAILVREDGPLHELAELRGQRAAWVDRSSAAGYLFPRLELLRDGRTAEQLFASEQFLGSTTRAAAAVAAGEADICACFVTEGAVHDQFHAIEDLHRALGPVADQLRMIHLTGPIPPDGLVAPAQASATQREKLTRALLNLHELPRGQAALRELLQAMRLCAPPESVLQSLAVWG